MAVNTEPENPVEAYKAIIDQLVEETTHGMSARLVRESGIYSKAQDAIVPNEFVKSLDPRQCGMLADMLNRERYGAIHDTLAVLTWWLLARDVGLTFRGDPMPFDLSGMGLHGDYVGRCDGWEWPKEA